MKTIPRHLCGLLLAAGFCLGTAQAETLDISYQRSSTLLILLKRNGALEERLKPLGFDIEWHEFSAGLLSALNAGSVDLHADVADAFALFTQAADAPLTYYAKEDSSPSAQAILVAKDSPIQSVADLKGRKVAVTKGSGSHYLLLSALQKAGLGIGDIQPHYLDGPDALAAFVNGTVDALSIWDPFLSAQERGGKVRVLADGRDGVAAYYRFYMATTRFAERHPEVLEIVFDELRKTGQWIKANPREAAQILAPLWGNLPPETVEQANGHRSYAVVPVRRDELVEQQRIADLYRDAGIIPEPLDVRDIRIWPADGQ
ncbi:sulfonate transport system substrate-binding protein [Azotobacter beijerinckii]|nr:aliphatic sulfonate ABC transporter substrate-binding protein [Azotobacter beijerinckii]SEJ12793.1 sulfonate transport system substrate-binding protein [Azotobacter beijerinckii]